MYNLLMVDDEPMSIEGMQTVIQAHFPDLVIYTALSGTHALDVMALVRIDIVLTDIRMPGLNGIELNSVIKKRWPRCRTIFLTGYDDFDFMQSAVRGDSDDYILKLEGDEVVLAAVSRAIAAVREYDEGQVIQQKIREQLHSSAESIRRYALLDMLHTQTPQSLLSEGRLQELSLSVRLDFPAFILLGRVEYPQEPPGSAERISDLLQVHAVFSDYCGEVCVSDFAYDQNGMMYWLIQPQFPDSADPAKRHDYSYDKVFHVITQYLEPIQSTCQNLLELSVSFAMGRSPQMQGLWPKEVLRLQAMLLQQIYSLGGGVLVVDGAVTPEPEPYDETADHARQIPLLVSRIEAGDEAGASEALSRILACGNPDSAPGPLFLSAYYRAALELDALYRRNRADFSHAVRADDCAVFDNLLHADIHRSCRDAAVFLHSAVLSMISARRESKNRHADRVVEQINRHIEANLGGDLSIPAIAQVVNFSPAYLSRLYKARTGTSLSAYIAATKLRHANRLLADPNLNIYEIAELLGFSSHTYFTQFYRKSTNISPQEYRNLMK